MVFLCSVSAALHDLAVGREHGRLRQALLHQFQTHQTIVHFLKARPRKLDHVHFHAVRRQTVGSD